MAAGPERRRLDCDVARRGSLFGRGACGQTGAAASPVAASTAGEASSSSPHATSESKVMAVVGKSERSSGTPLCGAEEDEAGREGRGPEEASLFCGHC